jgi:hypothetical protein
MGKGMIVLYLCFMLHRFVSGLRNGLLYREGEHAKDTLIGMSIGMPLLVLVSVLQIPHLSRWAFLSDSTALLGITLAWLLGTLFTMAIVLPFVGVVNRYTKDVHLWTLLEQSAFAALLAISGPYGLAVAILAVYPAAVLQKGTINLVSSLPWNYHGTDDATGATYGLPSLGMSLPRRSARMRLLLAAISIILFTILTIYTWPK